MNILHIDQSATNTWYRLVWAATAQSVVNRHHVYIFGEKQITSNIISNGFSDVLVYLYFQYSIPSRIIPHFSVERNAKKKHKTKSTKRPVSEK